MFEYVCPLAREEHPLSFESQATRAEITITLLNRQEYLPSGPWQGDLNQPGSAGHDSDARRGRCCRSSVSSQQVELLLYAVNPPERVNHVKTNPPRHSHAFFKHCVGTSHFPDRFLYSKCLRSFFPFPSHGDQSLTPRPRPVRPLSHYASCSTTRPCRS